MLTRAGMRTVQVMGVPERSASFDGFDAVVVALKSRTNPATEAVDWSLRSADALLDRGARQLFFKYCSTFDSTGQGNIGPVAQALLTRVGGELALACPAFPANKRTVFHGNLFVGDLALADSPMKDHPLTPMRDSNLVRVLQGQTALPVGLIPFVIVDQGANAIGAAFDAAARNGKRFVVVDAIHDRHLVDIGTAAADHKLITGGSGIALGLPANFIARGLMKHASSPRETKAPKGRQLIISGSCSEATRGQVQAAIAAGIPTIEVDAVAVARGRSTAADLVGWALKQPADAPVLISSSAEPDRVAEVQKEFGREQSGAMVEHLLGTAAKALVAKGFTRIIVAGGETSGAVVTALGVNAVAIGAEIAPGVPWTISLDGEPLALALKSGNFGAPDFFLRAWDLLN